VKLKYLTPFILSAILLLNSSCSRFIRDTSIINSGEQLQNKTTEGLDIKYIGTACFLLTYNGQTVLTDPFVSNPSLWQSMFGGLKSDTNYIRQYINVEMLKNVGLVPISHAHYDHLLDLPYLSRYLASQTTICGSQTASHILASQLTQPFVNATHLMADSTTEGTWIYAHDSSSRVMPIIGKHPAHFWGITLFKGPYCSDLRRLPRSAKRWKQGQTIVYLIDFLEHDKRTVAHRIYFQSSPAGPPYGFFPQALLNNRRVDLAIVSISIKDKKGRHPEAIIDFLNPKTVLFCHWEDFFRKKTEQPKAIRIGHIEETYNRVKETRGDSIRIVLPAPGAHFIIK